MKAAFVCVVLMGGFSVCAGGYRNSASKMDLARIYQIGCLEETTHQQLHIYASGFAAVMRL
jgi:hypothetical protein